VSTELRDRCTMQCRVSVPSGARTDTRLPASSASRVRVRVLFDVCIDVDFLLPRKSDAWECLITCNVMILVHARTA
jgi:hypothetical protein